MEKVTKDQKGQEFISKVITEAWENETFKKDLINNPKATLEQFLGQSFDLDKKIKVVDQTDSNYVYINIPAEPELEDVELSEDQLDLVSGGADRPWYDVYGHLADASAAIAVAILDAAGAFDE